MWFNLYFKRISLTSVLKADCMGQRGKQEYQLEGYYNNPDKRLLAWTKLMALAHWKWTTWREFKELASNSPPCLSLAELWDKLCLSHVFWLRISGQVCSKTFTPRSKSSNSEQRDLDFPLEATYFSGGDFQERRFRISKKNVRYWHKCKWFVLRQFNLL